MSMMTMDTSTATAELAPPIRGFLLEIGTLTCPVYGDANVGWSIIRGDIADVTPYRYGTLDELVFALLNFSVISAAEA